MSEYYYLGASLPMIHFHMGKPPLTYQEFLDECRRLMKPEDYRLVHQSRLGAAHPVMSSLPILRKWQAAEFALRNEIVRIRAHKLGRSAQPYLRTDFIDPTWAGRIREIFEDFSPLRAEMHILALLWRVLDDLGTGHFFDVDFLIVYALKAQILERKASFDRQRGSKRLQSLIHRGQVHGV